MNIYEKLQAMRCKMQTMPLKKSGKNKFAGYEYFELQDIMPTINNLMMEHGVSSELAYGDYNEPATLKIINVEKPDEVMKFTCPVKPANLKGCHEVQNIGASITYIRRYLYINAFEIVEHDALDRMPLDNKPAERKTTESIYISEAQRTQLGALAKSMNYNNSEVYDYIEVVYGFKNSKEITKDKLQEITDCIAKRKVALKIEEKENANKQ